MKRDDCIFCNFDQQEVVIYEDTVCIALISLAPLNNHHVIVIPQEHYTDTAEIPDDILSHLYVVAKKMAVAVKKAASADGITTIHDDGLNRTINHFTLHIFPRLVNDEIGGYYIRDKDPGVETRSRFAKDVRNCLE